MVGIQESLFGKMFPELSQVQVGNCEEKISGAYSKSSSGSKNRMPRCLRLIKVDGLTQTSLWEPDGRLLTELSILNTGESPNAAVESTLSQILEASPVPERYYLSAQACEGILRRANRRGKELPEMLRIALEQQIERMKE